VARYTKPVLGFHNVVLIYIEKVDSLDWCGISNVDVYRTGPGEAGASALY